MRPFPGIAYAVTDAFHVTLIISSTWTLSTVCQLGVWMQTTYRTQASYQANALLAIHWKSEIIVGSRDVDLLHVLQLKHREIENIVKISVQQHPQKFQFNSVIELVKPMQTNDDLSSSQPDRISIPDASKMERVDFGGLADKTFHAMVEQMLLALNNFASHGSGWTLDQILNIEIRLGKAKPIRASSYLALPGKIARTCSLLNIRNREDENCFLYCYTAAYHLKFGPRILPPGASSRRITAQ